MNKRMMIRCFLVFFFALFFIGFYLTALPGSRHSSAIRVGLLLCMLALLTSISWKDFPGTLRARLEQLEPAGKVFVFSYMLFFMYFLFCSVLLLHYAGTRRILVVFLFVSLIAWGLNYTRLRVERIIFLLGMLGAGIGMVFLIKGFILSGHTLSLDPLRLSSSGYSWLATYGNTIIAGLFYAYLLAACAWSYFSSRGRASTVFYYTGCVLLLFMIFQTGARTAWVASFVSLMTLCFAFRSTKLKKAAAMTLPIVTLSAGYFIINYKGVVRQGLTYRDDIWAGFIENMSGVGELLFGKGPSASLKFVETPNGVIAFHSHNVYLEVFYMGGIVGVVAFAALLISMIYNLIKKVHAGKEVFFIVSVLSGGLVAMFFDFSRVFHSPNLIWLWLWFSVAFSLAKVFEKGSQSKVEPGTRS